MDLDDWLIMTSEERIKHYFTPKEPVALSFEMEVLSSGATAFGGKSDEFHGDKIMRLKKGVSVHGLNTEILVGIMVAESVWAKLAVGTEMVITSGTDGVHSKGSKHYTGDAVDLRTRDIPKEFHAGIVSELQLALNGREGNGGGDFDVVLESTHIHLEYDPE